MKFDENFIKTLINKEFWFSNPIKAFNDPYDSKLSISGETDFESMKKFLEERDRIIVSQVNQMKDPQALEHLRNLGFIDSECLPRLISARRNGFIKSNDEIVQMANDYIKNPDSLDELMNVNLDEIKNNYRLLCLSKEENNILMWAHYSGNHSGIRVKLSVSETDPFFTFPIAIKYDTSYPIYKYFKERNNISKGSLIEHIVGIKFKDWEYENEVRILKEIKPNGTKEEGTLFKFDGNIIQEIAFGLNSNDADIKLTRSINEKYYNGKIVLKKATKKINDFTPQLEEIPN